MIGDDEACYYNYATTGFSVNWHLGGSGGWTDQFASHALLTTPYTIDELCIYAPKAYLSGGTATMVTDVNKPSVVIADPDKDSLFCLPKCRKFGLVCQEKAASSSGGRASLP